MNEKKIDCEIFAYTIGKYEIYERAVHDHAPDVDFSPVGRIEVLERGYFIRSPVLKIFETRIPLSSESLLTETPWMSNTLPEELYGAVGNLETVINSSDETRMLIGTGHFIKYSGLSDESLLVLAKKLEPSDHY